MGRGGEGGGTLSECTFLRFIAEFSKEASLLGQEQVTCDNYGGK